MNKPQWIIDNEEWGNLCGQLNGLVDELCLHNISKMEFYDHLKEAVQQYRKKTQ